MRSTKVLVIKCLEGQNLAKFFKNNSEIETVVSFQFGKIYYKHIKQQSMVKRFINVFCKYFYGNLIDGDSISEAYDKAK